MPWANIPKEHWPAMEKCVTDVMGQGKDKSAATAICYNSIMGRNFDPNVGGGSDRDKMAAEDFAGKNRSFPIKTPQDVADAARSIGRAGADNYDAETLKRNIIRIAKRKGQAFVDKLPAAWKEGNQSKSSLVLVPITSHDLAYVHTLLGTQVGDAELLKFEGAVLCKEGRNLNGDGIKVEGLHELAATLPLMAIDEEHHDRRVVGFITNPRVENGQELIDGIIYARRFPDIIAGILAGTKKLSVEAFAEVAECSECKQTFASEQVYCAHLQGRRTNGATRWLSRLKGIGAGVTDNPAEPTALFDNNHVTFLASLENSRTYELTATTSPDEPVEPEEPEPMEELMDEEKLKELEATLADVRAQLASKTDALDQATAKIGQLEAQIQAGDLSHSRSLELLEAGFTRAEVEKFGDKLAGTDETVFQVLKATKVEASKTLVASTTPAPEKPKQTAQTVLGGDQDVFDLSAYNDIFA